MSAAGEVSGHNCRQLSTAGRMSAGAGTASRLASVFTLLVEAPLVGSAVDDQCLPGIGLPLQSESFASSRSTEQTDAHKAQVMQIFYAIDQLHDLLRGHRGAIDRSRLRHFGVFRRIVADELQFLRHSHYRSQVDESMFDDRF